MDYDARGRALEVEETGSAPARPPPLVPPGPALSRTRDEILWLQRQAGNAAVGRMLDARCEQRLAQAGARDRSADRTITGAVVRTIARPLATVVASVDPALVPVLAALVGTDHLVAQLRRAADAEEMTKLTMSAFASSVRDEPEARARMASPRTQSCTCPAQTMP